MTNSSFLFDCVPFSYVLLCHPLFIPIANPHFPFLHAPFPMPHSPLPHPTYRIVNPNCHIASFPMPNYPLPYCHCPILYAPLSIAILPKPHSHSFMHHSQCLIFTIASNVNIINIYEIQYLNQ